MSKEGRHRIPFSGVDDIKLVKLVQAYGTNDWGKIAQLFGNRNARQCKDRWEYFICPNVSKEPWTKEEEDLLVQKYNELGSRWKVIAKFFPNRTHINVRNQMNKIMRKNARNLKSSSEQESNSSPQVQELETISTCPEKPQGIPDCNDLFETPEFSFFDDSDDFVSFF